MVKGGKVKTLGKEQHTAKRNSNKVSKASSKAKARSKAKAARAIVEKLDISNGSEGNILRGIEQTHVTKKSALEGLAEQQRKDVETQRQKEDREKSLNKDLTAQLEMMTGINL